MSVELTTIDTARDTVLGATPRLPHEQIEIERADRRVLARDVVAAGDVPPFPCSAMDGYALQSGPAARALEVVAESRAGEPSGRALGAGEAIRVSTGAAIPDGADAVIPQEEVELDGTRIVTAVATSPGTHVRPAGEDVRAGTTVLKAGTLLGVAELGAAVSAGAGSVLVSRRPRVAVLCTGDELRAPGEPLGPGEIHNSNGPMLIALAARAGAESQPVVRLSDSLDETRDGLALALDTADVVVISGGVSVGPHDHVKPALAALGVDERFWRVALQPGKPTWFGVRDRTLVFGLPGNPVSAVVTFTLFVAPALAALQGAAPSPWRSLEAELGGPVQRNPIREQAVRVRLTRRNGALIADTTGPQGSNLISSLTDADALALIPPGAGEIPAGASVALERLPR